MTRKNAITPLILFWKKNKKHISFLWNDGLDHISDLEKIEEEIQISKKKFKDLTTEVVVLKSPLLDVQRHIVKI